MLNSPCYDKETKTDCPDRHEGCAVNCPKWAAYVKQRDAMYAERVKNVVTSDILTPAHRQRVKKNMRMRGKRLWRNKDG